MSLSNGFVSSPAHRAAGAETAFPTRREGFLRAGAGFDWVRFVAVDAIASSPPRRLCSAPNDSILGRNRAFSCIFVHGRVGSGRWRHRRCQPPAWPTGGRELGSFGNFFSAHPSLL